MAHTAHTLFLSRLLHQLLLFTQRIFSKGKCVGTFPSQAHTHHITLLLIDTAATEHIVPSRDNNQ